MDVAPSLVPLAIVAYFIWKFSSNVNEYSRTQEHFSEAINKLTQAVESLQNEIHAVHLRQERLEAHNEHIRQQLSKVEKRSENQRRRKEDRE